VKALSCERGIPSVKDREGLTIRRVNAEHAIVEMLAGAAPVQIGDKIEIWVRYSDATVNLHERMYGVRNGHVEAVFQLSTRGCR
jgi:D-serine deaminase-like pyridoxal phosphate-dependent protein